MGANKIPGGRSFHQSEGGNFVFYVIEKIYVITFKLYLYSINGKEPIIDSGMYQKLL